MEQRISIITLGVMDLKKSRAFYDALGWQVATDENTDVMVTYNLNGLGLSLYNRQDLADDAQVAFEEIAHSSISLAYNVREKSEVTKVLQQAKKAGGEIVKPAEDVFWGGHSGYFSDPDGHLWEVAWNPFSPLDKEGAFQWRTAE